MGSYSLDFLARPFALVYRQNAVNHCPGCTHTNWMIGRMVAECGFCGTVLPLRDSALLATGQRRGVPQLAAAA